MTRATENTRPLILFGGTFDPVHRAHISCALAVSKTFDNCTVQLLPNAAPPHRDTPMTDGLHRLAMLELACAEFPELQVNDWELRQTGLSYSIQTLEHFRKEIGAQPLILLIGADSLANLHTWHRWQDFALLCHLVVAPRPGAETPASAVIEAFPEAPHSALLQHANGLRLMLNGPTLDLSATAIRHGLAEKGTSPAVNNQVLDYIQRHHLYNAPLITRTYRTNEDS
ncbi:MAG: nicotinate-nucleotide adenylyltransferase [Alcanivoracaceae bacterium]|nr:nicotinate-nucleotide adenylyltransferase [Alcanivoracaceae bacterium]